MTTSFRNNYKLREAAGHGNTDEVRRLIPISDPKFNDSQALIWAAAYGHTECVRLLIPVSDANPEDAAPLFKSAQNGHAECVQLLLPVTDPLHYPRALNFAAMEGRRDCVEILMRVTDPTDEHSNALRTASRCGRNDIVDVLFEVSDVDTALDILMGQYPNTPQYWQYLKDKVEAFHAQQQNQVLRKEIAHSGAGMAQRKM